MRKISEEELKEILDKHKEFLSSSNGKKGKLADLHNVNINFTHADFLHGADLRGANLAGANLYGMNLQNINLSDANLHIIFHICKHFGKYFYLINTFYTLTVEFC